MPTDNASVVRKAVEAANAGQATAFAGVFRGEQAKQFGDSLKSIRTAFPDVKFTLEHVQAKGDQVTFTYTVKGTHKGKIGELKATNKAAQWQGWGVATIKDGAIADLTMHEDWVRAGIALGANPSMSGTWSGGAPGATVNLELTQKANALSGNAELEGAAGSFPVTGTNNFPNVKLQGKAFGLSVTFTGAFSGPDAVVGTQTVQGFPPDSVTLYRR